MLSAPIPADEDRRIENLKSFQILDTAGEREFDDLTFLASQICGTPIASVTLIDSDRQWFKSKVGLDGHETPRSSSFCAHAILGKELLIVTDPQQDVRFADNPLVTGDPLIRFYAGAPLISPEGYALGTICVIDRVHRTLSSDQQEALRSLARQAVSLMRLRRTLASLLTSERFANSTVDALTSHIAILDETGTIIAVNRAWKDYSLANPPLPPNFSIGTNYLQVCQSAKGRGSEEASVTGDGIRAVLQGKKPVFELEYPCHSRTRKQWFLLRVSRFSSDGPTRVVVSHDDITVRRLLEQRLRHDALHDALTGLPNRALFSDRVQQCIESAKRKNAGHFAVLFIDLDRFKVVNDSLGHAAGDKLLTAIAHRLNHCLRKTDSVSADFDTNAPAAAGGKNFNGVARLGGDEFTVLLDFLSDPSDVVRVAERLLSAISQPIAFGDKELTTTASIGIVIGDASYQTAKELLRDADSAMYRAKEAGKARYIIFDSTMHRAAVARLELENSLRRAAERGELLLYYQPIVSLVNRKLKGFEALMRWRHEGQLVSPADFIPVAEDTGLILPMGAWAIAQACRQLAHWKSQFVSAGELSISINVSRKQLVDVTLVSHLEQVLRETGLNPQFVTLELTESAFIYDDAATMATLSRIKATGVKLSMDDFGTAYSSLSCLHQFPLDVLKVDRSFVLALNHRPKAAHVVRAVVGLAHALGMQVVAEGVEASDQVAFLQMIDCDLGQGYLFSKPLPAAAAERFIEGQSAPQPIAA
jgi:predicted signal transduction protein with EAL and GGDEF domain